jgi:hypothetical protein
VYVCLVKDFVDIIAVEYLAIIVDESAYNSLKQAQNNTVVL